MTEQLDRWIAAWRRRPEAGAPSCDDWTALVSAARASGVQRLVFHALTEGAQAPAPPALAAEARRVLLGAELKAQALAQDLDRALVTLDSAGVRAAPYKGPFLAERLWPARGLRLSGDLDLLVAPPDLPRAIEALEGIGYRRHRRQDEASYERLHHDVQLSKARSALIELHHRPLSDFGVRLPAGPLLARGERVKTQGGAPAIALAPEDELHVLAVHAAQHLFLRLSWLVDLDLLIGATPGLDWRALGERARAAGSAPVVAFALGELRRRLRTPLPQLGPFGLAARGPRQALARRLLRRTAALPLGDPQRTAGRAAFVVLLCATPGSAVRTAGGLAERVARRRLRRWLG